MAFILGRMTCSSFYVTAFPIFGPSPLGAPEQRIDWAFLGWLAFGPSLIGALVLGRLARGTGPGSMVPTMPRSNSRTLTVKTYKKHKEMSQVQVQVRTVFYLKTRVY